MNSKTLHVCLVGLHPLKSYDNVENLIFRILSFNSEALDVKINIIHSTADQESYLLRDRFGQSPIGNFINWVEYESSLLKLGRKAIAREHTSVVIQHEPMEFYLQQGILETDFVLRCRSDHYLTDEFLKMLLSKEFFKRLENADDKRPIFSHKVWMPYVGTKIFLDCCDYFYVASVKDQKKMLITDLEEAESLWLDPFLSPDRSHLPAQQRCFAERIFFIKPLLGFLRKNRINEVSEGYWDLIHSNFSLGGDPSPIKTCFYGWRNSAWCRGKVGYKVAPEATEDLVSTHASNITNCSKINPQNYEFRKLSRQEYIY